MYFVSLRRSLGMACSYACASFVHYGLQGKLFQVFTGSYHCDNICKSNNLILCLVYVAGHNQWKNIRSSTLFTARVSKNARNHKTFVGKEISTRTF